MDLRRQIAVLRSWGRWIALGVVLAAVAAFLVSQILPKVYEADTRLLVGQALQSSRPDVDQFQSAMNLSQTYAEIAGSRSLLSKVRDDAGIDEPIEVFRKRITVVTGAQQPFIDVFATEATFNTPRHIEFAAGTLWAAGEADRVWRFDAVTGAFLNKPQSDNPRGLVLGADGLMYVSSSTSGIFRHDAITGASVDQFSPPPPNLGDNDIAFGPDGNLYASGGDRVRRFDAVTGAFIDDFVAAGSGGLSASRYFVFAPDTEVPEPGTWSVLGLALLALAFTWVRRSHVARARRPGVPSGTARTSASR